MSTATEPTTGIAEFLSVGQLAADIQQPVKRIFAAADSLGIAPALKLNRVAYFSASQADVLTAYFRNQGAQ